MERGRSVRGTWRSPMKSAGIPQAQYSNPGDQRFEGHIMDFQILWISKSTILIKPTDLNLFFIWPIIEVSSQRIL